MPCETQAEPAAFSRKDEPRLGNQLRSSRAEKMVGPTTAEGSGVQRPSVDAGGTGCRDQGHGGPRRLRATPASHLSPPRLRANHSRPTRASDYGRSTCGPGDPRAG